MSRYFPFRSNKGDRKYSAEDWAAYFALFLSNGIFYSSANKMKVVENDGMTLTVVKGAGFINGRMFSMDTDFKVTLDTADGVLNRIDRIVLRCNYTDRKIEIVTIKGSYSENPIVPDITRDADAYDLVLADVYVGAGVITITAANITDQRLNTELCGIVTGMVEQADTTEIFNQFQAYFQEFKRTAQEDYTAWTAASKKDYLAWTTASKEEFDTWFDEVKIVLGEDVAGNLLLKINQINSDVTENGVRYYSATATIAEELTNIGFTMDNTIDELYSLLYNARSQFGNHYFVFTSSMSTTFSNSLPVSSGGIIEFIGMRNGTQRKIIKFYNFRTNDIYIKSVVDGTLLDWEKLTLNSDLPIVFTEVSVAATDWTTYTASLEQESNIIAAGYTYAADITLVGVTTNHAVEVSFGAAEIEDGVFAPYVNSRDSRIRIYANAKPTGVIIIPTITAIKKN